jgi:hypothetical protein
MGIGKSLAALALVLGLATPAAAQGLNPFGNSSNSMQLYGPDGTYLGNLNSNALDPNSISNPLGPHGSPLATDSIHNPFTYGSPFGYSKPPRMNSRLPY